MTRKSNWSKQVCWLEHIHIWIWSYLFTYLALWYQTCSKVILWTPATFLCYDGMGAYCASICLYSNSTTVFWPVTSVQHLSWPRSISAAFFLFSTAKFPSLIWSIQCKIRTRLLDGYIAAANPFSDYSSWHRSSRLFGSCGHGTSA